MTAEQKLSKKATRKFSHWAISHQRRKVDKLLMKSRMLSNFRYLMEV